MTTIVQRIENSRRLGRLLGSLRADFDTDNEVRAWWEEHPGAAWEEMPERFREYLERLESATQ